MDWQLIRQHLTSGYIPVAAALPAYFIVLFVIGKRQTFAHIAASFVFCFYLVGILVMAGVWFLSEFSPRTEFVPFADMIRGPAQTALNVLLFVPLGLFLPLLYKRYDKLCRVALTGLVISLSVEIAQMFGTGTTDINDLITNTAGTCMGYGIFRLLRGAIPKSARKALRAKGVCDCLEAALFWICSLAVMLTIQMTIFHKIF